MTTTAEAPATARTVFTREQVADRIILGQTLFIYNQNLINATNWAAHHPGGALALLHFVGRDATDEIDAYHSESAKARMLRMTVGAVKVDPLEGWQALTPPIALGLVRHKDGEAGHWQKEGNVVLASNVPAKADENGVISITREMLEPAESGLSRKQERVRSMAYRELKGRIVDAGLFERPGPLAGYGKDIARYLALGTAAFSLFFL
jgi:delta8-fatty-acid desaturase